MGRRSCSLAFVNLAVLVALLIVLVARFKIVPAEGYPTWQATRNYLFKNGSVTVTLPETYSPISARCTDGATLATNATNISRHVVTTNFGYGPCTLNIIAETDQGEVLGFSFKIYKTNAWNRVVFIPRDTAASTPQFQMFENGIPAEPESVAVTRVPPPPVGPAPP